MMASFPHDEGLPAVLPLEDDAEKRHLRRALVSQPVIDQAKGMLMARHGCTAEEAFQLLRRASMRQNRKIRDIACAIIEAVAMQESVTDREAVLAIREQAADDRDDAFLMHEAAVVRREADVEALLLRALRRDQLAEVRDRSAENRDLAAVALGDRMAEQSAAADRNQSALDRVQSGTDRDLSAGDRADLAESV
jgi:ANTAR domain